MIRNLVVALLPLLVFCEIAKAPVRMTEFAAGGEVGKEFRYQRHQLFFNGPKTNIPRRMFTASCEKKDIIIVGWTTLTPSGSSTGNLALFEQKADETIVEIEKRNFPECNSMYGVATSADCTEFYALCRGAPGQTIIRDFTDPFAGKRNFLNPPMWKKPDFMYLYHFKDSGITSTPDKYSASNGQGGAEIGNCLVVRQNDKLVIVVKQFMVATNVDNSTHEADSVFTIQLSDMTVLSGNSDPWSSCGGHSFNHRLAYNPYTDSHLLAVGNDVRGATANTQGFFTRNMLGNGCHLVLSMDSTGQIKVKGGAGTMAPTQDGWLMPVLGRPEPFSDGVNHGDFPTQIGVIRMDKMGAPIGKIVWIIKDADHFLASPQIAEITPGKYLLGWGEMGGVTGKTSSLDSNLIPSKYLMVQINEFGETLGDIQYTNYGWNDEDNWVSVGGTVMWPFTWTKFATTGKYEGESSSLIYEGSDKLRIMSYGSPDNFYSCSMPDVVGVDKSMCQGPTVASNCHLKCKEFYSGNPSATCATEGGQFDVVGCVQDKCSLPSTTPPGFNVASCAATTANPLAEPQCSVSCEVGTAVVSCPKPGGVFDLGGCSKPFQTISDQWRVRCVSDQTTWDVQSLEMFLDDSCTIKLPVSIPMLRTSGTLGGFVENEKNLLDGNTSTTWTAQGAMTNVFVGAKFSSPKAVRCVKMYQTNCQKTIVEVQKNGDWNQVGGIEAGSGLRKMNDNLNLPENRRCSLPSPLDALYEVDACTGQQSPKTCKLTCKYVGMPWTICPSEGGVFQVAGCYPEGTIAPTDYRVRRLGVGTWSHWAIISEVEFYADDDCTYKIPTDKPSTNAGVSGGKFGAEPTVPFDNNRGTMTDLRQDPQGMWISYKFDGPTVVKCAKMDKTDGKNETWSVEYLWAGAWRSGNLIAEWAEDNNPTRAGYLQFHKLELANAGYAATGLGAKWWRVVGFSGLSHWSHANEVEFYADSGCTTQIPTNSGLYKGMVSCGKSIAEPELSFDKKPATFNSFYNGQSGCSGTAKYFVSYEFPIKTEVKCARMLKQDGIADKWRIEYEEGGVWRPTQIIASWTQTGYPASILPDSTAWQKFTGQAVDFTPAPSPKATLDLGISARTWRVRNIKWATSWGNIWEVAFYSDGACTQKLATPDAATKGKVSCHKPTGRGERGGALLFDGLTTTQNNFHYYHCRGNKYWAQYTFDADTAVNCVKMMKNDNNLDTWQLQYEEGGVFQPTSLSYEFTQPESGKWATFKQESSGLIDMQNNLQKESSGVAVKTFPWHIVGASAFVVGLVVAAFVYKRRQAAQDVADDYAELSVTL